MAFAASLSAEAASSIASSVRRSYCRATRLTADLTLEPMAVLALTCKATRRASSLNCPRREAASSWRCHRRALVSKPRESASACPGFVPSPFSLGPASELNQSRAYCLDSASNNLALMTARLSRSSRSYCSVYDSCSERCATRAMAVLSTPTSFSSAL